jgi:membrane associated rhomboid family serine protease
MSHYYYSPRWTNVVKYLLLINFLMFVIGFVAGPSLYFVLGLVPKLVWRRGMVWQLFTYMFLHGGFFHFLFNMFLLWMFGSELERHLGSREFLKYYCITGVGAGVLTLLASPNSLVPTVGASGAIYGLLLAYALYFPNRLIYLWFLIPIKAKHLVIFFGIIEFFAALSHTPSGIAHFAHLGGILVGFVYLKARRPALWSWLRWKWIDWWASRREEEISDLQMEVDRILEKISEQGIKNLTEREKRILDRASKLYDGEIK